MEKLIEKYEETKRQRVQERAGFRRDQTTQKLPYPKHLRILPEFPTGRWLEATVSKAKRDGLIITEEEEELALGCDWHVSQIYLAYIT